MEYCDIPQCGEFQFDVFFCNTNFNLDEKRRLIHTMIFGQSLPISQWLHLLLFFRPIVHLRSGSSVGGALTAQYLPLCVLRQDSELPLPWGEEFNQYITCNVFRLLHDHLFSVGLLRSLYSPSTAIRQMVKMTTRLDTARIKHLSGKESVIR